MSISVLVCGYDKYQALWAPFKHGFDKYWSDCPWEKYFITNRLQAPLGFNSINTGIEINWGDKMLNALHYVKSDIIFCMMEDFWFPASPQTQTLVEFYDEMTEQIDVDHIRLLCPFGADGRIVPEKELTHPTRFDPRLWYFREDAEYRASVSACFWRRDALLSYLKDGMTPWTFEQQASVYSTQSHNSYLCTVDPKIFPLCHSTNPYPGCKNDIMTKGQWTPVALEWCKREGLDVDFSVHPNGTLNTEYATWLKKSRIKQN